MYSASAVLTPSLCRARHDFSFHCALGQQPCCIHAHRGTKGKGEEGRGQEGSCLGFALDQQVFMKMRSVHAIPVPPPPRRFPLNARMTFLNSALSTFIPSGVTSSWTSPRRCWPVKAYEVAQTGPAQKLEVPRWLGLANSSMHRKGHSCNTLFWEPWKPPPLGCQRSGLMLFLLFFVFQQSLLPFHVVSAILDVTVLVDLLQKHPSFPGE